jgi:hypothetical protein
MQKQTRTQSNLLLPGLLVSRLILFLTFQAIIALIAHSWETSEKYWLLSATLTNLVSITLLYFLFRSEGKNYLHIFRFKKAGYRKDLLVFLGLTLLSGPVVFAPGYFISKAIWNDPNVPTELMFGPVEDWVVYILLIAFPVTIALAELATYFGYIMPKLRKQLKAKWLAVLLPVVFLSLQHCTLPFIPDFSFILYRALVFLPFASLIGVSIYYRPSLFPYFAILHGLMDFGTAFMFFSDIAKY